MRRWAAVMLGAALLCGCASGPAPEAVSPGLVSERPGAAPAEEFFTIESVETWTFGGALGRQINTRNYRLFTTEKDAVIVDRAPRFLELALDHYRSALGPLPAPPLKLDTFLMDNRTQWSRLTLQMLGEQGRRYQAIGRGGFATGGRAFLYDIGLFDTLAIAAHEGWHQYTQRTFRDPLPVWLEEGIAAYMEGHRWAGPEPVFLPWANLERFDQLRSAKARGAVMTLPMLLDSSPQDMLGVVGDGALTYYAQVWALIHFLNEGADGRYRETLRALLVQASQGQMRQTLANQLGAPSAARALTARRGPEVFQAYFGEDLTQVSREYEAFMSRLVIAGSRGPIAEGRSPFEAAR